MVESQPSKLLVAGSIPVSRSIFSITYEQPRSLSGIPQNPLNITLLPLDVKRLDNGRRVSHQCAFTLHLWSVTSSWRKSSKDRLRGCGHPTRRPFPPTSASTQGLRIRAKRL